MSTSNKEDAKKNWNVKVQAIPLVVGSLGAISKYFGKRLQDSGSQHK